MSEVGATTCLNAKQPNLEHSRFAFHLMQMTLFEIPTRKRHRWRFARNAAKQTNGRLLLAGGVIFDKKRRILLLHRSTPQLQQWETPGGKVNQGETPEEAAVREVKEELGVLTHVIADLGAHDINAKGISFRYALFALKVVEGTPMVIEEQTFDDLRYFSESDLLQFNLYLSPNALNLLKLLITGRISLDLNQILADDEPEPLSETGLPN